MITRPGRVSVNSVSRGDILDQIPGIINEIRGLRKPLRKKLFESDKSPLNMILSLNQAQNG